LDAERRDLRSFWKSARPAYFLKSKLAASILPVGVASGRGLATSFAASARDDRKTRTLSLYHNIKAPKLELFARIFFSFFFALE
jgi:hypothetical protein